MIRSFSSVFVLAHKSSLFWRSLILLLLLLALVKVNVFGWRCCCCKFLNMHTAAHEMWSATARAITSTACREQILEICTFIWFYHWKRDLFDKITHLEIILIWWYSCLQFHSFHIVTLLKTCAAHTHPHTHSPARRHT